jgi:hypothetical protein
MPGWAATLVIVLMFIAAVAYLSYLTSKGDRPWAVWTDPLLKLIKRENTGE